MVSRPAPVVTVEGLAKRYGQRQVLHGIDLEVDAGEVFCLLGPNGAGKTTTVEILEGFRAADAGRVRVLGWDPAGQPRDLATRIGVVPQQAGLPAYLTVRELLTAFAGYYPAPRRVDELLEITDLRDRATTRVSKLSGGQQRRLDLALALAGDPDLVFLDEPTTGLDPLARRRAWTTIQSLASTGVTVFLTTHYLDEAEQLADRVGLLVAGRVRAQGTPVELAAASGAPTTISYVDDHGEPIVIEADEPHGALARLLGQADRDGEPLRHLAVRPPTLDDAYHRLVADHDAEVVP